jgi:hypothetical protein
VRTYLGVGHPYANKAGWQWRSRLVMQELLGRVLHRSEHVHHIPEVAGTPANRADDRPECLEVLACEYHGRLHAFATPRPGLGTGRARSLTAQRGCAYAQRRSASFPSGVGEGSSVRRPGAVAPREMTQHAQAA